jgi:hypothetical protein
MGCNGRKTNINEGKVKVKVTLTTGRKGSRGFGIG